MFCGQTKVFMNIENGQPGNFFFFTGFKHGNQFNGSRLAFARTLLLVLMEPARRVHVVRFVSFHTGATVSRFTENNHAAGFSLTTMVTGLYSVKTH